MRRFQQVRYNSYAALAGTIFCVVLFAIRPVLAQSGYENAPGSQSEDDRYHGSRGAITDPYEGAMRMMSEGKYAEALKVLKVIVAQTPDSEIALLQIGQCYLNLAKSAADADAAQRDVDIGTGWIIHAAAIGLRDAQEELVQLYLDGKVFFADPQEAGKWYLIWKQNRSDVAFGIGEFNPTLEKRLKLTLTPADWSEAEDRVKEWERAIYSQASTPANPAK